MVFTPGHGSQARLDSEELFIMGVARTRSEPERRSPLDRKATLDDLYGVEGKAELIDGRIVPLMPTGRHPHRIAFRIARSLDDHAATTGPGEAYSDNIGFAVPRLKSGRESFSPDASYYDGPMPANKMRFVSGPPTFAVEVRSENDYGPSADEEIARKRADYFEAGTKVVWDVDPIAERISAYRANAPAEAVIFEKNQIADAETAVPGWRIEVDRIFA
jgi:Uma2 family endonuclease